MFCSDRGISCIPSAKFCHQCGKEVPTNKETMPTPQSTFSSLIHIVSPPRQTHVSQLSLKSPHLPSYALFLEKLCESGIWITSVKISCFHGANYHVLPGKNQQNIEYRSLNKTSL